MEIYKINPQLSSLKVALLLITFVLVVKSVNGQVSTPCTTSMISTFTPCLNYITGSTSDGATPSSNCCDALKSVMSSSMDCACLMVTASVPLPLIVNRTLALGLPRICKAAGVPVKCEASKATALTPASKPTPTDELPPVVAPSSIEVEAPSRTPKVRPVLTPPSSSSASMTLGSRPNIISALFLMGFMLFKL
ncbi:Protein YLS3 [Bienertia sinuspersici]